MVRPSLDTQLKCLRQAAHRRGLRVRKDDRLKKTPFRAMNQTAAKVHHVSCPKGTVTYTLSSRRPKHRLVMDTRHELIEEPIMKRLIRQGVSPKRAYKIAHKIANARQRTIGAAGEVVRRGR